MHENRAADRKIVYEQAAGAEPLMRVGVIGTGAIAWKHAQAYKNIGYAITAATDRTEEKGRKFAAAWGGGVRGHS